MDPRVIEDRVPCLGELRGNGHVIVAEVMNMVFGGALDVVGDPYCVPGATHCEWRHLMGLVATKKGHVVTTRQIFNEKQM